MLSIPASLLAFGWNEQLVCVPTARSDQQMQIIAEYHSAQRNCLQSRLLIGDHGSHYKPLRLMGGNTHRNRAERNHRNVRHDQLPHHSPHFGFGARFPCKWACFRLLLAEVGLDWQALPVDAVVAPSDHPERRRSPVPYGHDAPLAGSMRPIGAELCTRTGDDMAARRGKRSDRARGARAVRADAHEVAATSGAGMVRRKRAQSTFGLTSGEARADLASVAPRDMVADAEREHRLHVKRSAAMRAGLIPTVAYAAPVTTTTERTRHAHD